MTPHFITRENIKMPKLIYGTAWKKDKTADYVTEALKRGFRGIDTACQPKHYNEPGVGEGIRRFLAEGHSRSELFIQSKYTPFGGQDPSNTPYDPSASLENQVEQSIAASLSNLGIRVIDSLVLHSPLSDYKDLMQVWQTMENHVRKGTVRQIGISNCYDQKLFQNIFQDAEIPPAVLQNRFYKKSGYDVNLRKFCHDKGIVYQSFWTLSANPDLLNHPVLVKVSCERKKTAAQVLFRYLTQSFVAPLTGTKSTVHMQEDLDIFQFELSKEEIQMIDRLCTA